jgi:hypothetical protein
MSYTTQNSLLLNTLVKFYNKHDRIDKILPIINGEHHISLRLIDWFVTNYSKKYYTTYKVVLHGKTTRLKIYNDYKLKLKAYSKKRFDPFCRWDRITIPYNADTNIQTTIGQLNFFKWILENNIMEYIDQHLCDIERDMNNRNRYQHNKNNSKRAELSISAIKSIKKEDVVIVVEFD